MDDTHPTPTSELLWLNGHQPLPVTGPCPHDCAHDSTAWIAYGPDAEHYTLNQCADCACRAWFNNDGKHRTRWLAHR